MHPIVRLVGIGFVLMTATIAWVIFGGIMSHRTDTQTSELRGDVGSLWGTPQVQAAPGFTLEWIKYQTVDKEVQLPDGTRKTVKEQVPMLQQEPQALRSTRVSATVGLDQRLKGLMWYSLYDLGFQGTWTWRHDGQEPRDLRITFAFPDRTGLYDDFHFLVDGQDIARQLRIKDGQVDTVLPVTPGQEVQLAISYVTRGMDQWEYAPGAGVANLEDFQVDLTTDFDAIDYPQGSLSPSNRTRTEQGWKLEWDFKQVVTGQGLGVVMPEVIQPGQLAAELSFSAPISLLFFFVIIFVLSTLRNIEIHPINYLFIASAFFAFHLLFGYSVDHLDVRTAFVLSSVVSVVLVVSYLRLVVSDRFAFVEAALAQLLYLVGFSMAHFWEGFTGLTVTVLSIVTLFAVMQLTGRIRWSQVLQRSSESAVATPAIA